MNLVLLEKLTSLYGVSGDEKAVREFIKSELPADCEIKTDNIGNLIVFKKGEKKPKNKTALFAHMDEVGFIITSITEEGLLKFTSVGGITPSAVFGRRVVFKNGTAGVIASKAVHMVKGDEKDKQPSLDELTIDIGVSTKEEAEKLVSLGDNCYFENDFFLFGDNKLHAKALDDRMGCMVMLEMLKSEQEYDLTCVFTVQEEVGLRGAGCAVYTADPDFAVVIESTTACDISGSDDENKVCCLGEGAVVSFMDRSTIYDKELYNLAFETAKEIGVKCQTKTKVAGGNDSGAIHKAMGGIRTTAISVPTRYLHTASCVVDTEDIKAVEKLVKAMHKKLCEL